MNIAVVLKRYCLVLIGLLVLASGCATSSTIEKRRQERLSAYQSLSPEEKALVDNGQIKIGMSADGVYVAWGAPSEVLEAEDSTGRYVIWRFIEVAMQETRYWAYREVRTGTKDAYLERYLTSDFHPRDYVKAEIVFKGGKVDRWRTLPKPIY